MYFAVSTKLASCQNLRVFTMEGLMISAAHVIVYTKDAEADRASSETYSASSPWMPDTAG